MNKIYSIPQNHTNGNWNFIYLFDIVAVICNASAILFYPLIAGSSGSSGSNCCPQNLIFQLINSGEKQLLHFL